MRRRGRGGGLYGRRRGDVPAISRRENVAPKQFKLPDYAEMNHIEAGVLDRVALVYPDIFGELAAYADRHAAFTDERVMAFDREIQFYLAAADLIAPLDARTAILLSGGVGHLQIGIVRGDLRPGAGRQAPAGAAAGGAKRFPPPARNASLSSPAPTRAARPPLRALSASCIF